MDQKEVFNIDNSDVDLGVLFAGTHKCPSGHRFQGIRDHFIFHLVLSGRGVFRIADRTHVLRPGDVFFIPPGTVNDYQADEKDPWTYRYVGFSGLRAADLVRRAGLSGTRAVLRPGGLSDLDQLFRGWNEILTRRKDGYELEAVAKLYSFLALCSRNRERVLPTGTKDRKARHVKKVIEFVRLNFQRRISVAQIAGLLGLDRTYLSGMFRERMGMSLLDFIHRTRMSRAKELLRSGTLSVAEVAYAVGYDDYFTFAKWFKRNSGKTPSEIAGTRTDASVIGKRNTVDNRTSRKK
jgi:AraC-like DNA-binding protein